MKRWLILFSLLLVLGAGIALGQPPDDNHPMHLAPEPVKPADNRITQVTVYQNNALVTREVDVPGGTGTLELVVTPMPPTTVNSSLYSEGTDGILVLTTRF